ncbi:ADP-ribosylation factor GTPase-activating protein 2 [Daktulosphaira vitifoliae]|uniref:ADP-ribosylation factor GTPase-activating protein 2 n=1 Tax=Daktulosphaira vitifoliae TaxID=58002 RepID=UPI0021AA07D5|nr:ADP-ribosylation factor GTPase-activating protein 2 [Daktulosphaira vitifoliae]XP_050530481.1 ADP-ribosylation factor GTPase-activating protein 2 [Daktulosphaira vitifoliae]XP_050530489.1 ADP-ribosylation factor GTPase-activating protein 2 [Daktulosphaira vitifoliae]
MAEAKVNSEDIELVFQRLRALPGNKTCFDCDAKNPTWSSITYGVFICLDCSAVHRSMGVHLTFVRSTQLDTNWTWLQLRQMQLGGNVNATSFFRQHNCASKDAQQKYNSRAAQLYRDKLFQNAKQAMKIHGTKLFLDSSQIFEPVESKTVDFFEQHTSEVTSLNSNDTLNDKFAPFPSTKDVNLKPENSTANFDEPKILSDSQQKSVDHKSLLGGRQAHSKRSGLGGKRLGLGAQKIHANFAEIEKEAEMADKLRFNDPKKTESEEKNSENQETQISSMRLAYEDLSIKKNKEEEKLKQVDPKKAAQLERLGMGYTSKNIVSHSALNDMTTLDKEETKNSTLDAITNEDKFYDCFEEAKAEVLQMINKSHHFSSDNFFDFDDFKRNVKTTTTPPKIDVIKNDWDNVKPAKKDTKELENDGWDNFESSGRKTNRYSRNKVINPPQIENNEAVKKFGGAKSISSAQYFGNNQESLSEKSNLSRFEGSNSISSAQLFGRQETYVDSSYQAPDLEEVKESVKQGVTRVAGKLSSLANGVMSSFQEKYGGY